MKSSIGLIILKNLGLTDAEAEILENQKPEKMNTVYARDQSGLGYKKQSTNYVADANDVFARLSAKMSQQEKPQSSSIAPGTGVQTKRFIPKRLQKKSIGSLSHEDLATILGTEQPTDAPEQIVTTDEEPKKHRRKHRHHHHNGQEEQN